MTEQWLPWPRNEDYWISDQGGVYSVFRRVPHPHSGTRTVGGKILSQRKSKSGYPKVRVNCEGVSKSLRVHRLVLEAFVGPCPEGHEARHLNDIPSDGRLANLEWGTRAENAEDVVRNGHRLLTECKKKGHPFTPENTKLIMSRNGRPVKSCRICANAYRREWKRKRRRAAGVPERASKT